MTLITIIISAFLAILTALFIFKRQITLAMAVLLRVLFAVFLALALSALFLPQIYQYVSEASLTQVGVYATIRSFDSSITGVTNAPSNILDSIFNPNKTPTTAAGPLETGLWPNLISLIAGVYRLVMLSGSVIALIVIVYLSYATSSVVEVAKLERRLRNLEQQVAIPQAST